jgi:hypothetical protein
MRLPAALIATVVIVAACGGKARPASTAPAAETPAAEPAAPVVDRALLGEIADGLVDVLATMASITEGATDCAGMAAQLGALFDKSAPLFELARAQGADAAAAPVLTAEMDARADRVQPLVDRISAGLARCQMDPAVGKVIERMPTF